MQFSVNLTMVNNNNKKNIVKNGHVKMQLDIIPKMTFGTFQS